jgi:nucleoside 2-deoxyribosyltransferase
VRKYFVAYRFTGENPKELKKSLSAIVEALGKVDIEAYCNIFDQHEYDVQSLKPKQIMEKAFAKIDESDGLFVLITSENKSEGQLIEVGYALAKGKNIVAAVHEGVATYVPDMANLAIKWNEPEDLRTKLEALTI